jgi:hypothetical protein
LLDVPFEQTPHCASAVQVVARSPQSFTVQLDTLVQLVPPKAQVPELLRGQSLSTEQACAVVWFELLRHSPYGGQSVPRLQAAPPYWHRGVEVQGLLGLQVE